MFIQTEATPNPATLKFLPGRVVMPEGTFEARASEEAGASPLADRLFAIAGVTGVFYGHDFITVTKTDSEWQHLKPAILGAIMEHFMTGAPLFTDGADAEPSDDGEEFFDEEDASTVATIKELLETRIRPAVAGDGGDITFRGYQGRHRLSGHEGRLLGLPLLHRHPAPWHPEPAPPLPAGRARGPGRLRRSRIALPEIVAA